MGLISSQLRNKSFPVRIIKKYSNRRLYDTEASRYITLEELAERVREGDDVRVVDAKTGADLTQATLAQIILESRGAAKLLPVPLLTQLIRMGDDALAEFFSNYMSWALEVYWAAKRGMQGVQQYNPFAALGIQPPGPLGQVFGGGGWGPPQPPQPAPPREPEPERAPEPPPDEPAERAGSKRDDDVAELRRELDELKDLLRAQAKNE